MQSTTTQPKRENAPKKKENGALALRMPELTDIVIFFVGTVLGRTHLAFGAYPFGIAFLCALPTHVFVGLAGAVAGAVSRGRSGILFAMIAFIALFVRILISGAEKGGANGTLFRETLALRMSAGAVGGFVSAVYDLLMRGIVPESVLFSLTMIFGVALSTVAFGLLFSYPITLKGALFHPTGLFSHAGEGEYRRKKRLCIFSILCYLLALTFGLSRLDLLGVTLGGVFAFGSTLFVARRFGSVCASVVGFLLGLVVTPDFAVACALSGAVSGILFPYGTLFGEISAVVIPALWGIYTGGAVGLLSLFPEGLIATLLSHPILMRVPTDATQCEQASASPEGRVKALLDEAMQKRRCDGGREDGTLALSDGLLRLSAILHNEEDRGMFPSEEQYRALLERAMENRCKACDFLESCPRGETGFYLSMPDLYRKLLSRRPPDAEDIGICAQKEGRGTFADALRVAVGRMEEEAYRNARRTPVGDLVRTFGEMTKEASARGEDEGVLDEAVSGKLTEALKNAGLLYAEAKVFGKIQKRVIVSALDEDGTTISSARIMKEISLALGGATLGTPSYMREGAFVLLQIATKKRYSLRSASAVLPIGKEGISGDVIQIYEGNGGRFFGILSDGIGSGASARECARFAQDVLRAMLERGVSVVYVLRLLDEIMRRRNPEDGATLDLFTLDMYLGKAEFYKLGAVTSFIKRGDSLFSIRSHSLPLGIADGGFHGERICASIEADDIVVLFSDGVAEEPAETPWLLEFLAHTELRDPKVLAEQILLHARRERGQRDDMSALVCVVGECERS